MSGTWRKLLLLGLGAVGGEGAARANISATGTFCNEITEKKLNYIPNVVFYQP